MILWPLLSSRQYLKRVWRVPKDRGASHYLAAILCKALRKHGWPANIAEPIQPSSFQVLYHSSYDLPQDFADAVSIASRIVARTYRLDITEGFGSVQLNRYYRITSGGQFSEAKE